MSRNTEDSGSEEWAGSGDASSNVDGESISTPKKADRAANPPLGSIPKKQADRKKIPLELITQGQLEDDEKNSGEPVKNLYYDFTVYGPIQAVAERSIRIKDLDEEGYGYNLELVYEVLKATNKLIRRCESYASNDSLGADAQEGIYKLIKSFLLLPYRGLKNIRKSSNNSFYEASEFFTKILFTKDKIINPTQVIELAKALKNILEKDIVYLLSHVGYWRSGVYYQNNLEKLLKLHGSLKFFTKILLTKDKKINSTQAIELAKALKNILEKDIDHLLSHAGYYRSEVYYQNNLEELLKLHESLKEEKSDPMKVASVQSSREVSPNCAASSEAKDGQNREKQSDFSNHAELFSIVGILPNFLQPDGVTSQSILFFKEQIQDHNLARKSKEENLRSIVKLILGYLREQGFVAGSIDCFIEALKQSCVKNIDILDILSNHASTLQAENEKLFENICKIGDLVVVDERVLLLNELETNGIFIQEIERFQKLLECNMDDKKKPASSNYKRKIKGKILQTEQAIESAKQNIEKYNTIINQDELEYKEEQEKILKQKQEELKKLNARFGKFQEKLPDAKEEVIRVKINIICVGISRKVNELKSVILKQEVLISSDDALKERQGEAIKNATKNKGIAEQEIKSLNEGLNDLRKNFKQLESIVTLPGLISNYRKEHNNAMQDSQKIKRLNILLNLTLKTKNIEDSILSIISRYSESKNMKFDKISPSLSFVFNKSREGLEDSKSIDVFRNIEFPKNYEKAIIGIFKKRFDFVSSILTDAQVPDIEKFHIAKVTICNVASVFHSLYGGKNNHPHKKVSRLVYDTIRSKQLMHFYRYNPEDLSQDALNNLQPILSGYVNSIKRILDSLCTESLAADAKSLDSIINTLELQVQNGTKIFLNTNPAEEIAESVALNSILRIFNKLTSIVEPIEGSNIDQMLALDVFNIQESKLESSSINPDIMKKFILIDCCVQDIGDLLASSILEDKTIAYHHYKALEDLLFLAPDYRINKAHACFFNENYFKKILKLTADKEQIVDALSEIISSTLSPRQDSKVENLNGKPKTPSVEPSLAAEGVRDSVSSVLSDANTESNQANSSADSNTSNDRGR